MNILMMTNTYLPHVGGVAGSVARFTQAFQDMGHQVLVVAPTYEDQPAEETGVIRVPAIQEFNGSDFSVVLPIPKFLHEAMRSFEPHVVHAHHPFLIGSTALRVAREYVIPLIYTYHTQYEYYTHYVPVEVPHMQDFVIHLSAGFAELADGVIAPSESIADLLKQREVHTPIQVVPTGIFPASFQAGDGSRARRELGIPEAVPVVGHVGRLSPEKNLTFLARAVSQALQKQPEAVFLMVGHGPSAEPIREHFESQGLNHRVFMPGSLTGRNLADAYHAMNLFVFTSRTETQGMVLTEAMAAGVPVVGLDAPGVREVVVDQVNGLLVGEEDATIFGDALDEALQWTPEQRRQRQQAARKTAEQFAMPSCAERLLMAYQNARERLIRAQDPKDETLWQRSIDLIKAEWELWTNMAGALGEAMNTTDASGDAV